MQNLKLFQVHCGFYDMDVLDGVYEAHVNFVVAAETFEDARARVKLEPDFQKKKMHVDGLQLIEAVQGFRVELRADESLEGKTLVTSSRHRDLAPKKSPVV
jgi:acyl-CoA thioesterase FadM